MTIFILTDSWCQSYGVILRQISKISHVEPLKRYDYGTI